MDTYFFDFKTRKDELVEVTIYDSESTTNTNYTLTPSENPVVITMQDSDDVMEPVRYSSAKINVICKSGDVFDLTSSRRYIIRITKAGNNIFTGYLKADAYTQEYSDIADTFTYNAVDFLGAAEGQKLTDETLSFHSVIAHMAKVYNNIAALNGYLIIGNSLPIAESKDIFNTLKLGTRAENWRQEDEDTREQSYSSVFDFIREWCIFFGMTAYCNGDDLFICSADDSGYYRLNTLRSISTGAALQSTFFRMIYSSFSDLSPTGSHTIDYKQPANKAEMKFGGDAYDSSFPDFSHDQLDTSFTKKTKAQNTKGQDFDWFIVGFKNSENGNVNVYRRTIDNNNRYVKDEFKNVTSANFLTCAAGASFILQDYWNTNEKDDPGSKSEESEKRNYALDEIIYIWGKDPSTGKSLNYQGSIDTDKERALEDAERMLTERTQYPIIELSSEKPIKIPVDSGICISFDAICDSMIPLKYSKSFIPCDLIMSLRIGDNWWDGERWQNYEARFKIAANTQSTGFNKIREVFNTKYLSQPYTCDGYSIPITDTMFGIVEVKIYSYAYVGAYEEKIDEEIIGYYPRITVPDITQIMNLKFEYCESFIKSYQKQNETTRRLYETHEGGIDSVSAATTLSSTEKIGDNTGIVYGTFNMVNVPTALTGSAETITFDRMKRLNFSTSKRVTISASDGIPIPSKLYDHNGETYRIESATDFDLANNTINLKFLKI